jgi:hypothetical protein
MNEWEAKIKARIRELETTRRVVFTRKGAVIQINAPLALE